MHIDFPQIVQKYPKTPTVTNTFILSSNSGYQTDNAPWDAISNWGLNHETEQNNSCDILIM